MSKSDKLKARFSSNPKDFTWAELKQILELFGYFEMKKKGKTAGSRRKFVNNINDIIILHEPHPSKIIRSYVIKYIKEHLGL